MVYYTDNFYYNIKPSIWITVLATLTSLLCRQAIKDSLGFKTELNERIKSALFLTGSFTIFNALFYENWSHLFNESKKSPVAEVKLFNKNGN